MNTKEKAEGYELFSQHMEFVGDQIGIDYTDALQNQKEMLLRNKKVDFMGVERWMNKMYRASDRTDPPTEVTLGLIGLLDVTCKYRPHCKMGDYWIAVIPRGDKRISYIFYYKRVYSDGRFVFEYAHHPHISSGHPCLGNFERYMTEALVDNQNVVSFVSNVRKYLETYNGNSVYNRGKYYTKKDYRYEMISSDEYERDWNPKKIRIEVRKSINAKNRKLVSEDMGEPIEDRPWKSFSPFDQPKDDSNRPLIDKDTIMRDPMRWGYPGELAARGHFTLQGQDRCSYERSKSGYWNGSPYGSGTQIEHTHPKEFLDSKVLVQGADWYTSVNQVAQYYNGYVMWIHKLLEVDILEAQDGLNRFLTFMFEQYKGFSSVTNEKQLKNIFSDWSNIFYGPSHDHYQLRFGKGIDAARSVRNGQGTGRIYIKIDNDILGEVKKIWPRLEAMFGNANKPQRKFCIALPSPSMISNKIGIMLRKPTFEKVKYKTFFKGKLPEPIGDNIVELDDKLKDDILAKYHRQLENETRRCTNEWKEIRPDIQPNITSEPGEQASLFS